VTIVPCFFNTILEVVMREVASGLFLTCDESIKELLARKNETDRSFIRQPLDDSHLVIDPADLAYVEHLISAHSAENALVRIRENARP
jgi:hypothetical protein